MSLHFSTMGQWTCGGEREASCLLARAVKSVLANWVTCLNQAALIFMWSIRGRPCEKRKAKKKKEWCHFFIASLVWFIWIFVITHRMYWPLSSKGNQSWMFIGRTDAEAETSILWPPDVNSWLIWKDPDAGKDWRWEEKGMTEDEMVGWHHWRDNKFE